jgi:hypothetical protein
MRSFVAPTILCYYLPRGDPKLVLMRLVRVLRVALHAPKSPLSPLYERGRVACLRWMHNLSGLDAIIHPNAQSV